MEEQMSMILNREEMNRISFCNPEFIRLDVHGLTVHAAKVLIKKISCLWRRPFSCEVIHGYNHGCAILKMIRTEKICNRTYKTISNPANAGVTTLCFQ